ncbi:MAG TPA: FAD-dependent oxidoreductase [Polyangiales bacterium]|nr:FAD-dependent oxidoreductase [Polyangiales bacterium]
MRSTPAPDALILGGGIAGLTSAVVLASRGLRVRLLERERRLASQASGNNAAIFRPLEHDVASAELPRRSRELLEAWFGPGLLEPTGLLLVSDHPAEVHGLGALAQLAGVAHELLGREALHALAPSLQDGEASHALWLREAGVLDVPALTRALAERARSLGARLETGVAVRALDSSRGRVAGVVLGDGTRLPAGAVIAAAGAWNARIGIESGVQLPLAPLRRHLVELQPPAAALPPEPVVWRLEDEIYYRRCATGLLASPCDEMLAQPGAASTDAQVLASLTAKLRRIAPALAGCARRRAWACLRTFASDRELVLGEDPRLPGLFWFAGLGGRGMGVAPAAAEIVAAGVMGEASSELAARCAPGRLLQHVHAKLG